MNHDRKRKVLAQIIADAFFYMQAGEDWNLGEYDRPVPNSGDVALAEAILREGDWRPRKPRAFVCSCSERELRVYPGVDGPKHTERCGMTIGNRADVEW